MRRWWQLLVCGIGILLGGNVAYAGLYSTLEPPPALSAAYFGKFQEETLIPLKQLATPTAVKPWQKYYELAAAALAVKDAPPVDALPVEDRVNLAICLLRVREPGKQMPEKAIAILKSANKQEKDNFLVLSTLGTAYQIKGDYRSAEAYLSDGLKHWLKSFRDAKKDPWDFVTKPDEWQAWCAKTLSELNAQRQKLKKPPLGVSEKDIAEIGKSTIQTELDKKAWTGKQFAWFAKCELYQHHLVRMRLKDGALTFDKALANLDPLFDPYPLPKDRKPLRFVGESGSFEPGKIAAAEKAKLPPDAIEIVEQMLYWIPDDLRLYWLLGELFNARGGTETAETVLGEFLGKFAQSEAMRLSLPLIKLDTGESLIDSSSYLARFTLKYPEVGNRYQAVTSHNIDAKKNAAGNLNDIANKADNPAPPPPKKDDTPAGPLKLDWQTLCVGLGAGAVAGFLLAWRLRDVLRRRQQTPGRIGNAAYRSTPGIQTDPH